MFSSRGSCKHSCSMTVGGTYIPFGGRRSRSAVTDRDLEIDPRMLKVFPYVLRIFPCMFYPCMLKVLPRMLIFPRVVVLAAWPWHSHTIFWSCRLVVCPSCGFPSSQAIFRCLLVATSACGFSHFVVLPACGPAALYPPNLRLSQLIGLSSLLPRGPSQLVAFQLVASCGLSWPLSS
jgi:hypothetical protein